MNWFRRFMEGRYGADNLSRFMLVCALVFMILYYIFNATIGGTAFVILYYVSMVLLIWNIIRIMSRNYPKRSAENQWYLGKKNSVVMFFKRLTGKAPKQAVDRDHKIFRCPGCGQKVRVPRGRGRIAITCPKCKKDFVKKT